VGETYNAYSPQKLPFNIGQTPALAAETPTHRNTPAAYRTIAGQPNRFAHEIVREFSEKRRTGGPNFDPIR